MGASGAARRDGDVGKGGDGDRGGAGGLSRVVGREDINIIGLRYDFRG